MVALLIFFLRDSDASMKTFHLGITPRHDVFSSTAALSCDFSMQ